MTGRRARLAAVLASVVGALALVDPSTVAAHQLSRTFESRLPLVVYLAGAGGAVALSFVFVLVRDLRADPPRLEAADGRSPAGSASCCGRSG